jgi:hypothetical protein
MTGMGALVLVASGGLTLHLAPERAEILLGEPLRLTLTWRATRPIQLPGEVAAGGWSYDYVQIWVDGPGGRRKYREIPPLVDERVTTAAPLASGDELLSELLLLFGLHDAHGEDLLFGSPGTYTVMVSYVDEQAVTDSNTIRVHVRQPEGPEKQVFEALKGDALEVKLGIGKAQRLIERHPESRYLRLARIARYREMESRLIDRKYPDTGKPSTISSEQWLVFATETYRRMAHDLEESKDWGPFEDLRLAMVADYARRGGDIEGAERAKQELLARFGSSRVAQQIRNGGAKGAATPAKE